MNLWHNMTRRGENETRVIAATFSADSRVVICVKENGTILRWPVSAPRQVRSVALRRRYGAPYQAVAAETRLSGDGSLVCWAPVSQLGEVCLSETAQGNLLWSLRDDLPTLPPVCHICISPDNKYVATSNRRNALCLWRVKDGKCVRREGWEGDSPGINEFSADGQLLVTGTRVGTVKFLWLRDLEESGN